MYIYMYTMFFTVCIMTHLIDDTSDRGEDERDGRCMCIDMYDICIRYIYIGDIDVSLSISSIDLIYIYIYICIYICI